MCLWLITACLGLLPSNPSTVYVVQNNNAPTPILQPSTTTTTTTTQTTPSNGNMNVPPLTNPPTTNRPTTTATTTTNAATTTTTNTNSMTPTGGLLLPLILCNNSEVVCVTNPDELNSGYLPIDPRLGTTPSAAALQQYPYPPINGYTARVPSFDTAVRFPRNKRSIVAILKKPLTLSYTNKMTMNVESDHRIQKRQSCSCVAVGTCPTNYPTTGGNGYIDLRIVTPGGSQCPFGQVYCCTGTGTGTGNQVVACGMTQNAPLTAVAPSSGQAKFGEYPWQALILTRQNDYIAGGVLIDQLNVLTVTHRMQPYLISGTAPNVKVRLGEWDAAGSYEPIPYQEYTVQRSFSHPNFNSNTLQYDLTILRFSTPVPLSPMPGAAPTINRACLPTSTASTYTGQRCWVSGWGKNMFGVQGQYQQILKKVDVPIVDSATCQSQLRAARLGPNYVLDTTSFICAGGEANKDACTGDGGSGLVCQMNGQWTVVGLVSWGLGCAMSNVPGAYVNVAGLQPWIQQQVATQ